MCAPGGSGKRYVPSSWRALGLWNSWSTVVVATWSLMSTVTRWYVTFSGANEKCPGVGLVGGSLTTMKPSPRASPARIRRNDAKIAHVRTGRDRDIEHLAVGDQPVRGAGGP